MQAEIVYQKLIEGYRMEKPEYATSEVYDIMCQCWNVQPSLRPNFTQLVDSVGNLLESNMKAVSSLSDLHIGLSTIHLHIRINQIILD
ncbi:platelet-derived growth factor receptor alpha-like [Augochlora pura]